MKQAWLFYYVFVVRSSIAYNARDSIHPCADSEPQLVEDAVKYIIFLVDADSLFDTALGMYDFSLVLMIAQHAQKVYYLIYKAFSFFH